ncbi:LCP family protein [Rhizohabitans arisaemae]|uniref:LCP family protein n=1 Tax=Rhizohabitans arisaemae TaxID=2720610 RepID=UPI0024B200E6|nr:LCP family protein [Rhizohabitans arisaemae]
MTDEERPAQRTLREQPCTEFPLPAEVPQRGLGSILLLTAATAVVPGLAHLRADRTATGTTLLSAGYGVATVVLAFAFTFRDRLPALAVQPSWLIVLCSLASAGAAAWAILVLRSYTVLHPAGLPAGKRVAGALLASVLALTAAAPFAATARYAYLQYDLVTDVFQDGAGDPHAWPAAPPAAAAVNPLARLHRLNVLLLGGDDGPGRFGLRTDTLVLASVNTATGRTALLSLPRNLEGVPFPPGTPMRARFPHGFDNLINALWGYGAAHPELVPGSRRPGPDLVKAAVGQVLGIPVHHYVLVNMSAFATLVDAVGGVRVNVAEPVRWGETGVVLQPGVHRLTGAQALVYARSRTGTSDYTRMSRQRCLLGRLARQANPITILTRYHRLARAAKQLVSTDIPRQLLPALVDLAPLVRTAPISSVTFIPPAVKPWQADWARIRELTRAVIEESDRTAIPKSAAVSFDDACS